MIAPIYVSNTLIGFVVASQVTHYWWRRYRDAAIFDWMMGAWILTVADVLFAVRALLPATVGALLPTLLVTVGHAVLLLGARQTAGVSNRAAAVVLLIAAQAAGLVGFLFSAHAAEWRMVFNGLFWAGFCFASAASLRRAPVYFWNSTAAPAAVFVFQGMFHLLRIGLASLFAAEGWMRASAMLQFVSDTEVSIFMGALFIALLLAQLQLSHERLVGARMEVQTLSKLLPVCAWCKKVRDDDGYWREVMEFLVKRDGVQVTHGVCEDCASRLKPVVEVVRRP